MAEAIISALATQMLEGLSSFIQDIGASSRVKKELTKLKDSLSTVKAILLDAERKGAMNHEVKDWLRKLKDVAYDAQDVWDEFATEALRQKVENPNKSVVNQVRRSLSNANPLVFSWKMADRVKDITERLDRIQKDDIRTKFEFTTQSVDMNINIDDDDTRHTTTDPFVIESEVLGREKDKENLVKELLTSSASGNNQENSVMFIPIVGIGGLGKTALAQYVFNDERVKKHFDSRMWVCVSFDFDIVHLAKKILKSLTNKEMVFYDETHARLELRENLSGKRYLLVLDDVWNDHPVKWDNLYKSLIGGASGSMILVTTRSQEVASIMHPIKLFYPLEGLNKNDCELLFNRRAFGKGKDHTNYPDDELVEIGKGIVKKCGGVPLAAKALGSLFRLKRNKEDWLEILKTGIWDLEGELEILPALMISYNHLPSHLKQCFAYCSLFPQDHEIDIDDLIHQWMAQGYIQPPPPRSGSHRRLEDIGKRYFRELLWRSFFQEVREDDFGNIKGCKMHDLMHSLARCVAGKELLEEDSRNISPTSIPEGVRHVVLHGKEGDALNHQTLIPIDRAQKLRTLYLQGDELRRISIGFVSSLRGLRVLNLSYLGIGHVPSSIGFLEQLRYLDVSGNCFEALPNSLCRLYNLQTLKLKGCWDFSEWPRDMTKMVSLRHLEFGVSKFTRYMPSGLGQLKSLQTLGCFVVGANKRKRSSEIGGLEELHGLNQLRGSLGIYGIGNVRDARDAEKAKLKEKSDLQSLKLRWWTFDFVTGISSRLPPEDEELVLGNLQPHPNLKALEIGSYKGVKMPHWMIHSSSLLPNLVELKLFDCSNLKCLPLIGEFPCLRRLELSHLQALESICNKVVVRSNNNKRGGGEKPLVLFPLLEQLRLIQLTNLERWTISVVEGEEEAQQNHLHLLSSMFPHLTHFSLESCHNLTMVSMLSVGRIQHLTSLRKLCINSLDRLVSLPDCPAPATLEELRINHCPSLVRLPDCFFENLKSLSEFEILECRELTSLSEGIRHLTALRLLRIVKCPCLTTLPEGLENLSSLRVLEIRDCSYLSSLPEGIQHLAALETLRIDNCPGLRALSDGLQNLASRGVLAISDCPNLSLPWNEFPRSSA